jgi:DNA polymerase IV
MIACVLIRDYAISLQRQADPALVDVPLILVRYGKKFGKVAAASPEAHAYGVEPGLYLNRARGLCPGAQFLTLDMDGCQRALDRLLEILWTFTNRVEIEETAYPRQAVCYLDLGRLNEGDTHYLVEQIVQVIGDGTHLTATLGLARGKFTAYVAATTALPYQRLVVVPPHDEGTFLSPHPIGLLPLTKDMARKLHLFRIRTLGEFAALPHEAVVGQFGKQGRLLYQWAQGLDGRPVNARPMPQIETLGQRFENALEDRHRLDVVIHPMAAALETRLDGRSAALHELALTVTFENGASRSERLHLLQPVASAQAIAQIVQQLLARIPVTQGISGLDVALAHLVPNLPRQLELFTQRPARQRFLDLVQILAARYGADAFYQAMPDQPKSYLAERRYRLERVDVS